MMAAAAPAAPAPPSPLTDTWKWLLSIWIGAVMGLLAFLVDWGIDAMNNYKFAAVRGAIDESGAYGAELGGACRRLPCDPCAVGRAARAFTDAVVAAVVVMVQAALRRPTSPTSASPCCLRWLLAAWSGVILLCLVCQACPVPSAIIGGLLPAALVHTHSLQRCRCSFVEPLAAGSGIPEVKTYLNGVHIRGLLTIRTLVTKLSGICFSIAAGLIAGGRGRERSRRHRAMGSPGPPAVHEARGLGP